MTPSNDNAVTTTTPETAQNHSTRTEDRFDELLRAHYQKPIDEFGRLYLRQLAGDFDILRAVMYVLKPNADNETESTYVATAAYGVGLNKLKQKEIAPGDSIVGQVIANGRHRLFNDLSTSSDGIAAGFSYLHPQSMLILPLVFNEDLYGAMCLERLTNFDPSEVQQLQQLSRNLASTLQGILNNQRLQSLLAETRQQADEISAREEEMRQNMEELQSTQEEMQRQQKAIEKANRFTQVLFDESVLGGQVLIDEQKRCELINKKAVQMYGYNDKEEVLGFTPLDVSAPYQEDGSLSKEKGPAYLETALREGQVEFEWLHQRPDGSQWLAMVHISAFKIDGKPYMMFSVRDITEEKAKKRREQEQFAAQRRKFEAMVAYFNTGYWDLNLRTQEVYFSDQWVRMFDYEPGEIENSFEGFARLVHPEDIDRVMRINQEYIEGQRDDCEQHFRMRLKDGSYCDVESKALLDYDEHDDPAYMMGFINRLDNA